MKGNFKTLLRRFCLESTVLGLKYFYLYPDRLSRCFWAANLVGVLVLACVLTERLQSRFSEMPTQITIENQYEPVANLAYPAITLCSPNQITASYLEKLKSKIASDPGIHWKQALPDLLGFYEILPNVNVTNLLRLQTFFDSINITVAEAMGGFAQSCDDFLKLCYFERQLYDCKTLIQPVMTAHGICCSFNSKYFFNGKNNERVSDMVTKTVKTSGESGGLVVVADYDAEDAIDGTVLNGGAIKVMFTDAMEFPTTRESTFVETYTESFHIMYAAYTYCSDEVMTLGPNERKCYLNHEMSLPFFQEYSKSDCDLMCTVEAVREHCHCLLFHVPFASHHFCNVTSIPCIMEVKYSSHSMQSCSCLADCDSRQYGADFILGNLNAVPYMLKNVYGDITFNSSTLIMNFFFTNSMYVKKKQETVMSLTILASNLGGVFGLCLGCSCISVLEVIFYVYSAIRNHFKRGWQRTFVQNIEFKN